MVGQERPSQPLSLALGGQSLSTTRLTSQPLVAMASSEVSSARWPLLSATHLPRGEPTTAQAAMPESGLGAPCEAAWRRPSTLATRRQSQPKRSRAMRASP